MSFIHNSSVGDGRRSAAIRGRATASTLMSIAISSDGRESSASARRGSRVRRRTGPASMVVVVMVGTSMSVADSVGDVGDDGRAAGGDDFQIQGLQVLEEALAGADRHGDYVRSQLVYSGGQ